MMESLDRDGPGMFQCSSCQRSFTRMDHLARHVRSHLRERPFGCELCEKAFGRIDLLKRHLLSHKGAARKRQKIQTPPAPRVSRACRACAASKLKCDEEQTCRRCQKRGTPCERAPQTDTLRRDSDAGTIFNSGKPPTPDTSGGDITSPHTENFQEPPPCDFEPHQMSGFLRGAMESDYAFLGDGMGCILNFTIDDLSDFGTSDFGPFEQISNELLDVPVDQNLLQAERPSRGTPASSPHRNDHIGLGTEAYKQSSLGQWEPGPSDYSAAELENLALTSRGTHMSSSHLESEALIQPISRKTRDKLLAMILSTCKSEHAHLVSRAFPSAELLNDLLRRFAAQHSRRADSCIHLPTFNTNEAWPELLAALVAMGALKTGNRALHKFGFALQEAVRTTLTGKFEESNATTRVIWATQAMLFEIEMGLWSGMKRKMEIAESHCQMVYTMLRRAGRFQRRHNKSLIPQEDDTGEVLEQKWLEWVESESWKRHVFHAFVIDAQVSMAFLTPPVISFAEISLEMPASQEMWRATTALDWKAAFLKHMPASDLTLVEYLRRPRELPGYCDAKFSSLIILHGYWSMVSQHLTIRSALRGSGQSEAALALRQQELLQGLTDFRISMSETEGALFPRNTLVLEVMLMRFHMSLEDIEMFAGRGTLEQAREALPLLQRWVESCESRQAIWHAGQAICAAQDFEPGQMCGFYPIAVFHASLVLWAYSVVDATRQPPQQSAGDTTRFVCLDGPSSPDVQRFITLGKGIPCLGRGGLGPVPLSEPEAAMDKIRDILNRVCLSGRFQEESSQPLIQNLDQLLKDIGKAAATVKGEASGADMRIGG